MWRIEKQILDGIVSENFGQTRMRLLDFACGTGRILHHLESRASESVGIDLSPSMLEVARAKVRKSEIVEADITRTDVLQDRQFDLVTAFRFFPNAEPELRTEAMLVLKRHLSPRGVLVFNNHKNRDSSICKLARALGRGNPRETLMSAEEATDLISMAGLVVAKRYHLGVIPVTEKHPVLPSAMLNTLETFFCRCPQLWRLARYHIYVCRLPSNS
jgi:ubiquinone/menaquinone biosynthesis C-methylase UbiE